MSRSCALIFLVSGLVLASGCQPYRYRQAIRITAGTQTGPGFQVRVRVGESVGASGYDVQLAGHAVSAFTDIRFTDDDKRTLLPHWIESVSGEAPNRTAVFWVRLLDDLDSDRTLYLYYGRQNAVPASRGAATFDFFDSFETPFGSVALENAGTWQETPTYDGSGQAIHPDVVHIPGGWNGYAYWMAMTPYPGSNDQIENPSVLASHDGNVWEVPAGLTNPLIGPPPCDHLNDADMILNTDRNELWLYYLDTRRAHRCGGHEGEPYYHHNFLQLFTSADGVTWTGPVTVIDWDLEAEPLYLSPSVVQPAPGAFFLWVSNGSDTVILYESSDGRNWESPSPVVFPDPVWHLNVNYIPGAGEYWMLTDFPSVSGILRWAVSTDRMHWTCFPNPVLIPSEAGWDTNPYRGSFLVESESDRLRIWYSAYARPDTGPVVWHTGHIEDTYAGFLARLEESAPGGWTVRQTGGGWSSTTEVVRPGGVGGSRSGRLAQVSTGAKQIVYRPLETPASDFLLEWAMYDDLDDTAFKLVRVNSGEMGSQNGLGVWTGSASGVYVFHDTSYGYTPTAVERTRGWHTFGIKLSSAAVLTFFVDQVEVGSLSGQISSAASVSVEGFGGGPTVFHVDDLRVRKAAAVTPSISGAGPEEQGSWVLD